MFLVTCKKDHRLKVTKFCLGDEYSFTNRFFTDEFLPIRQIGAIVDANIPLDARRSLQLKTSGAGTV